jgi:glycosyltransferase involved in cell wall biosynthesis
MSRPRRLLSLAHSYAVAANRRLAHEMARAGAGRWEVTMAAPTYFHGRQDLRPVRLEPLPDEPCPLVPLSAYLTRHVHVFVYGGRLRGLLAESWDLIHCWEEPYILVGGQVAWWAPRSAALVYRTAQSLDKRYPPPFNWIEGYAMHRAAGWICSGRLVEETLRQRPPYGRRPMALIPLGVDTEKFRPDQETGRAVRRALGWDEGGPPVVGYLGRFVPEKGLELLTRALDRLTVPWRALFVGAGPQEPFVQEWAARQGGRVRVCTDVRHDRVPEYLNAMDVLCAPSQTTPHWREQFGRMTIEAFACGVPFVGSDSGEIPHVVGDAGLIVGEQDEAAWARALAELIDGKGRRRELGDRGLERARREYAWPVVARRYLDFFERVLDGRSHPCPPPPAGEG